MILLEYAHHGDDKTITFYGKTLYLCDGDLLKVSCGNRNDLCKVMEILESQGLNARFGWMIKETD